MCTQWLSASMVFVLTALCASGFAVAERKTVTLDTDPNLAGHWKFDETSGQTAADASKHGRNASLKGALSFEKRSVPGRVGKAVQLDGDDSFIEVDKYKGVTGTRPRTVAVWIKGTESRGRLISWGTEDFGQMFNFGHIRGRIGVTPHGGYLYIKEPTHDDKWHHLGVVVREAELPNLHDDVALYLDGAPAVIHDIGLLDLWPLETGDDLNVRIGQGFKGRIDDLRIYDRPLSDEEMKALFEGKTDQPLSRTQ